MSVPLHTDTGITRTATYGKLEDSFDKLRRVAEAAMQDTENYGEYNYLLDKKLSEFKQALREDGAAKNAVDRRSAQAA